MKLSFDYLDIFYFCLYRMGTLYFFTFVIKVTFRQEG